MSEYSPIIEVDQGYISVAGIPSGRKVKQLFVDNTGTYYLITNPQYVTEAKFGVPDVFVGQVGETMNLAQLLDVSMEGKHLDFRTHRYTYELDMRDGYKVKVDNNISRTLERLM